MVFYEAIISQFHYYRAPRGHFYYRSACDVAVAGFEQSENTAHAIACVNNLKQIDVVSQLYSNDNNEALLPRRQIGWIYGRDILKDMTNGAYNTLGKLWCPSMKDENMPNSYGFNIQVHRDTSGGDDCFYLRQYTRPSQTMTFADSTAGDFVAGFNNGTGEQGLDLRHSGRFNLVYMDGHAGRYNGNIEAGSTTPVPVTWTETYYLWCYSGPH